MLRLLLIFLSRRTADDTGGFATLKRRNRWMVKADDERKIGFQTARGRIVASISWQRSVSPVAKPKSGLTSTLVPTATCQARRKARHGGRSSATPNAHAKPPRSGERLAELAPPFFARGFFTPESKELASCLASSRSFRYSFNCLDRVTECLTASAEDAVLAAAWAWEAVV